MNTIETKQWENEVNRETWGPGPWDGEPDRMQWSDEATGLPCLAVRNRLGAWCGYVGLPAGHPWRDAGGYDDIDCRVHGGLTYGPESCDVGGGRICHETDGADDVMWIGFDCAHVYDVVPSMDARYGSDYEATYKTLIYVRLECARLAEQAKAAA